MATPRNSVERRFRVVDEGQYPLFLRRLLLKLVPFEPGPFLPWPLSSQMHDSVMIAALCNDDVIALAGIHQSMLIIDAPTPET